MVDNVLKIEANQDGIWIWLAAMSETETFMLPAVIDFLHKKGVRKYDESALRKFLQQKNSTPVKIAERDECQEQKAFIIVNLSQDAMYASVVIDAPFFTKPWPNAAEIKQALLDKNITFGIDDAAIAKMASLRISRESVLVAQGHPPSAGENARIELLLDPEQQFEIDPKAQTIDHRDRCTFFIVLQGEKIAVKYPAGKGENGMTVTGIPVPAELGKDAIFPAGTGVVVADDGLSLSAAVDGHLCRAGKKLSIVPKLEIKGDVDFSVGNINFSGVVQIGGGVCEGFRVVAMGGVEVKELVEGALVESLGDIVIHGGICGKGKARVIAGGSVTMDFANNAYIRSQSSIRVNNEIYHSDIAAQESILATGGRQSHIVGGKSQAGMEVVCQVLGNEAGTKTEVRVGVSLGQLERREELRTFLTQRERELEKLEANLLFLKKQERFGLLDEKKRSMMLLAIKTRYQLNSELSSFKDELSTIEGRLELIKTKAVIRVKGICYPGVRISIRGQEYKVQDSCKFVSFVWEDGEIRKKAYNYKII